MLTFQLRNLARFSSPLGFEPVSNLFVAQPGFRSQFYQLSFCWSWVFTSSDDMVNQPRLEMIRYFIGKSSSANSGVGPLLLQQHVRIEKCM